MNRELDVPRLCPSPAHNLVRSLTAAVIAQVAVETFSQTDDGSHRAL